MCILKQHNSEKISTKSKYPKEPTPWEESGEESVSGEEMNWASLDFVSKVVFNPHPSWSLSTTSFCLIFLIAFITIWHYIVYSFEYLLVFTRDIHDSITLSFLFTTYFENQKVLGIEWGTQLTWSSNGLFPRKTMLFFQNMLSQDIVINHVNALRHNSRLVVFLQKLSA